MSTKNVSKCSYYGKVLLDLTGDTVTESTLKKGATAHDATGTKITGTMTIPDSQAKTMDLNVASGDQIVKPDSGKVLSKVTIKKPSTFTAENIKKDVNIGGVVGTYAGASSGGGGSGETTSLQVTVDNSHLERLIFCLWQTSDGWMVTKSFDTSLSNFTIPNVIVGGYVIFTHDPSEESYFSCGFLNGVEDISVGVMDAEWDIPDEALVMKVTALSPSFLISLRST